MTRRDVRGSRCRCAFTSSRKLVTSLCIARLSPLGRLHHECHGTGEALPHDQLFLQQLFAPVRDGIVSPLLAVGELFPLSLDKTVAFQLPQGRVDRTLLESEVALAPLLDLLDESVTVRLAVLVDQKKQEGIRIASEEIGIIRSRGVRHIWVLSRKW